MILTNCDFVLMVFPATNKGGFVSVAESADDGDVHRSGAPRSGGVLLELVPL